MNRSKLLTVTAAIGILIGVAGAGVATTGALAAGSPAPGGVVATDAQATATPTTGVCPFRNADGTLNLDAMRAYVDGIHGEGWFDQMWTRMAANGVGPAAGYGPGTGVCPYGTGTGPGTGLAPQDGTGFQYGPGAGWMGRGGMMGAGFGLRASQ